MARILLSDWAVEEKMEDTRRHHRYAYDGSLVYRRLGPDSTGRIRNLSEGGLMVELPEGLVPGTALDLVLTLGDHPVRAEAEVVWAQDPTDNSNSSRVHGLKFTRLELQDRLTLAVFMAKVYGG